MKKNWVTEEESRTNEVRKSLETRKPRSPRVKEYVEDKKDDSLSLDVINQVLNNEGSFESVIYYCKQRGIGIYPEDIDFFLKMSDIYASYNDNPKNRLKYTLEAWDEGVLISTQKYINKVKKMLDE